MAVIQFTQGELQAAAAEKLKPLGLVYAPGPWSIREEYYGWYATKCAQWGDIGMEITIFISELSSGSELNSGPQRIHALRVYTATTPRFKIYSVDELESNGRLMSYTGWLYERQP